MRISARNKICLIVGDPVEHSLSPMMHNAAYEALSVDDKFVFLAAHVKVQDMEHVVKAVRVMNFRGLTCTLPHKIEVIKYLDFVDPVAEKIGAVNTVVNYGGDLRGYNTDVNGVIIPLEKITSIAGKKIAVIGAGGAARAMVFGLVEKGASIVIFNRTFEKAKDLAKEVKDKSGAVVYVKSMNELSAVVDADIVMNATSLGMEPNDDENPVPADFLHKGQICFDAVYAPYKTRFLREAEAVGAIVIPGLEMLLYQGTAQFSLYTGIPAPEEVMRKALMSHFGLLK
jgi:shikimate dehydrogenase